MQAPLELKEFYQTGRVQFNSRCPRMFWQEDLETMARPDLEKLQLKRLRATVDRVADSPFYGPILRQRGRPSIRGLGDLSELPFTRKTDLRDSYPMGLMVADKKDLVRLHASSGTTGKPTVVFYTRKDLDVWSDMIARCMAMVGVVPDDVFQNIVGYGLFTGGLGFHYGAEKLGVLTVPAATGRTTLQIELMKDFHVTAVHSTPSYALHLAEVAREGGVDPVEDLDLRIGMFGAEFWSDNTRPRLEAALGVDAFDSYGLSEMYGPGVAFECEQRDGLHIWEDIFLTEVIDTKTGEQVGEGEEGELVLTTLVRDAMPLLRYRTGDITRVLSSERCPCGRTHLRLEKFLGRTDDMLKIRGVNVFPSQIEHILMEIPELSENYHIELETRGLMDEITVVSEIGERAFTGEVADLVNLRQRVEATFASKIGLRIKVRFAEPGTLERSTGKAKRIVDKRREE